MEMTILNTNFEAIHILDSYESFLWVDKYYEPSTFELYTPVTKNILNYIKADNYILNDNSDRVMIIEDISIESDEENGNHLKAVGRGLESILDRRIVWDKVIFEDKTLLYVIRTLLNNSIINPKISDRKISNFAPFDPDDYANTKIAKIKVNVECNASDNVLDIIQNLCSENNVGFKVILDDDYQFVFKLYLGINRSYSQNTNSYVTFSNEFDNLLSSNYTDKNSQYKNVVLVVGEEETDESGDVISRDEKVVGITAGLYRRELYTDGNDIQKEELSGSKYMAFLQQKGITSLGEANKKREFDCKCDTGKLYKYGRDFFIGDIVQVANEYGIEASAMVTEFTWNYSTSGIETYPTFVAREETIATGKNLVATTLESLKELNNSVGEWTANIWTYGNIVLTVNQDAYDRVVGISVNGLNNQSADIIFNLGRIIATESDLVLSGCSGGSSSKYFLTVYDSDSNSNKATNYDEDTVINSINLSHVNYVRLTLKKSKTVDNITLYPMVRLVTEDSTFEPYDETLWEDT